MLLAILYSTLMCELFSRSAFLFLRKLTAEINTLGNARTIVLFRSLGLFIGSKHAGQLICKTLRLLTSLWLSFISHASSLYTFARPYKRLLLRCILITFFFIQTGWEEYEWVEGEE